MYNNIGNMSIIGAGVLTDFILAILIFKVLAEYEEAISFSLILIFKVLAEYEEALRSKLLEGSYQVEDTEGNEAKDPKADQNSKNQGNKKNSQKDKDAGKLNDNNNGIVNTVGGYLKNLVAGNANGRNAKETNNELAVSTVNLQGMSENQIKSCIKEEIEVRKQALENLKTRLWDLLQGPARLRYTELEYSRV